MPCKGKIRSNRGKIGHFKRVCKNPSKTAWFPVQKEELDCELKNSMVLKPVPPSLFFVAAGAPPGLSHTVLSTS